MKVVLSAINQSESPRWRSPWILVASLIGLYIVAGAPVTLSDPDRFRMPLKQGVFLFAAPRLSDPNFLHTVVLVVAYGPEGAMGLIINRPTDIPLKEALPKMEGVEGLSQPLFFGGPVRRNLLLALLRSDQQPERTQKVFDDVYFTGDREALRNALVKRGPDKPVRIYAGYAGWGPGQLDHEVGRGDWLIMEADPETVFSEDPDEVWPALFETEERIEIRDRTLDPKDRGPLPDRT